MNRGFVVAGLLLALAVGINLTGLRVWYDGAQNRRAADNLEQALLVAEAAEVGDLSARHEEFTVLAGELRGALAAASQELAVFDDRFSELLGRVGLSVISREPWRPASEEATPHGDPGPVRFFEATVQSSGPFASFLDLLSSLEAWPDDVRVHLLALEPSAEGARGTLKLVLARLAVGGPEAPR